MSDAVYLRITRNLINLDGMSLLREDLVGPFKDANKYDEFLEALKQLAPDVKVERIDECLSPSYFMKSLKNDKKYER